MGSSKDLRHVLGSDAPVEEYLAEADVNKDGSISPPEFYDYFRGGSKNAERHTEAAAVLIDGALERSPQSVAPNARNAFVKKRSKFLHPLNELRSQVRAVRAGMKSPTLCCSIVKPPGVP